MIELSLAAVGELHDPLKFKSSRSENFKAAHEGKPASL